MSRTGITFEEVKKAIAELQGRQKNPTVDAIREVLGTGSKSTIARFLRDWKAQHGLSSDHDSRLPSDLLGIVSGLWDALKNGADVQIEQYRLEYDTKTVQIEQQLTEARQLEAGLRQNIHSLEEQLHRQKEESKQINAKLMIESQDKARISERVTALEARRQENKAENQRLHQLLKQVQENLEHYQAATQRLREEQSLTIEKQQNEYEQRSSSLLADINAAINEKLAYQLQYDNLKKVNESFVAEHKFLEKQHLEIHGQYESIKAAHGKLQEDYNMLKKQHQMQITELAALQQSVTELQFKLKYKDEKMILLEAMTVQANEKIEILRNENQFSLQEKAGLEGQLKQMQVMLSSNKTQVMSQ